MATVYVNKPGGAIVHLEGGGSTTLAYGQPIKNGEVTTESGTKAKLADYVDTSPFADDTDRGWDQEAVRTLEANRRAALAENGQPNSSSSPVPGNYSDLDEDGAARLVANLGNYPDAQASVVKHEILFGGNRRKVIDAASEYALIAANAAISEATVDMTDRGDVTDEPVASGYGDPDIRKAATLSRTAEEQLDTPAPTGGEPDKRPAEPGREGPGTGTGDPAGLGSGDPAAGLRPPEEAVGEVEAAAARPSGDGLDDKTKPELVEYAESNEIEIKKSGTKDEILEQIRAAHNA